MKRIVLLLCVAFSTLFVYATEEKSLIITLNNGKQVEYKLSSLPEITFENDKMTVTAQTGSSSSSGVSGTTKKTTFTLWKVSTFTYGTPSTGISQVNSNNAMVIEGNKITVDGTHNQVKAFAYDGRTVNLSPTITGNQTIISLDGLQTGVYIIKINGKSIKIARQ